MNKQSPPRRGSITTPAAPWQGPNWPGSANTARQGLSWPVLKGNEQTAPPTPPFPGREEQHLAHPPTCWVPRPGRHTAPPAAFLTGQATPSLASG